MSTVACKEVVAAKEVVIINKDEYQKLQEQLILRTDYIMSSFAIRESYVNYVTQAQHDQELEYINNRIFGNELEQFAITDEDVDNLSSDEQYQALCSVIPALSKF